LQRITSLFLRAKHWQVFVLVWGTYFIGTMVLVGSVPEGPVENPLTVGLFAEVVMLPSIACLMGWLWSMGSFLVSISEPSLKLSVHYFRFAIVFPTLYLLTGSPIFLSRNSTVEATILLPLHLLAMFCLFYVFYFISKSLVIAEKREALTFNDYALSLLLLFFSMIGIWLIQPRINRLYSRRDA
jgi:hypothetical protein